MNNLPDEIICYILNYLLNTVDVINFSVTNKYNRKIVLQNKDMFNCVCTINKKFIDQIDQLDIIGKIKIKDDNELYLKNLNITNICMLSNNNELNLNSFSIVF